MRLISVKGQTVESILASRPKHERGDGNGDWMYRREYRNTYTDRLRDGEKITAGKWIDHATGESNIPFHWK